MNKCNRCGKEFYSDSEFQEHEIMHWAENALGRQDNVLKEQVNVLGLIFTQLLVMNVCTIMRTQKCTMEEACWYIHKIGSVHNKIRQEFLDRGLPQ